MNIEPNDVPVIPAPNMNIEQARELAAALVRACVMNGLVLTISQEPRQPFAMGNYGHRIELRSARSPA